ncbi:polysaccharide deacetylase family protein [Ammonicoccus fulvus]|uniref:Polysaccharide deacetylase family protein n=1 Tax=Ammonicoccus fulvus TaxID=3138240 RepID=A0ABZ3FLG1_9ACTN
MPEAGRMRTGLKKALSLAMLPGAATGASLLIYHRIGGGTRDELDVPADAFARQMRLLASHPVISLDAALDCLDGGDERPHFVITFDDGFEDVYRTAWPVLRDLGLPFTVYLASAYVSAPMKWEGATAKGASGEGLSWDQLGEMVESGLCTIGNHTHTHVRPEALTVEELDTCTAAIEKNLGLTPRHFTYPWGVPVPTMEADLRSRFRSASTGELGRNTSRTDRMRLRRIPVRRTDPDAFFAAKLGRSLVPERAYAGIVRLAKAVGVSA